MTKLRTKKDRHCLSSHAKDKDIPPGFVLMENSDFCLSRWYCVDGKQRLRSIMKVVARCHSHHICNITNGQNDTLHKETEPRYRQTEHRASHSMLYPSVLWTLDSSNRGRDGTFQNIETCTGHYPFRLVREEAARHATLARRQM